MIASGIQLKLIQRRPGDSSFGLMVDTYSHVLKHPQTQAAKRMNQLLESVGVKYSQITVVR